MAKDVSDAWMEHQRGTAHAEARHLLQRNGHLYAEDALRGAFEAGWHARPVAPSAHTLPKRAAVPKKTR